MSNVDTIYECKVIVVGEREAGKTALIQRMIGGRFLSDYLSTIGIRFASLRRESIILDIWDLSGAERYKSLRPYQSKGYAIIIYVLDSTKEAEENKRIFREFNKEITSKDSLSNRLQLIAFTRSDDGNSKLSKDYINEFDTFNVSSIVCSAKTKEGIAELTDKCFNFKLISIKKAEEELLVSKIERYSKILSKKNSQIAKDKATALNTIAKACRDRGMGQHQMQSSLSIDKIAGINRIIRYEKETIRQHRHWSVFNCFFNVIDAVSSSVLEHRVESNRLVTKLDNYLKTESLRPS